MTDTGESSSSDIVADADADTSTTDKSTTGTTTVAIATDAKTTADNEKISKEDLIELIRAVKFKNPDFSQRQVYNEIVTEIPTRFPQYADSLNPERLGLNDVKKAWKKAILQQQRQQESNSNNGNADLAQRLRTMTTNPQLYTIGLDNNDDDNKESTGSSNNSAAAAREYVAKFLEEEQVENSARERELLEDYVHVFLDVPGDSSVAKKPHQALINFQNTPANSSSANASTTKTVAKSGSNKKKKGGKKKSAPAPITLQKPVAGANNDAIPAPFEDAIVVKIQMAAPIDANDTAKHPMLLYDKSRVYKTFVHPEGAMTMAATTEDASATKSKRKDDDGYSKLAHWIRTQGIGGALGSTGGTKAYFYGRLTKADGHNKILSIYVKELAPAEGQDF
uniref:Uncharacterized protein n=1 Tax=Pseudo-nitzschia australis TaxID=44445 RepID=A0A6V0D7X3_9STRA|mmetsp:Transcript_3143/g.6790  ORF Transcript_3143/g.6790 Transcript_3143/m.6790 type:complete len:394 (+) Transcript_3143:99-1280(+)